MGCTTHESPATFHRFPAFVTASRDVSVSPHRHSALCCTAMKPQEITPAPLEPSIGLDAGERRRASTAYGRRAADLARLTALGLPVPPGIALSFDCVARSPPAARCPSCRSASPPASSSRCAAAPRSATGAAPAPCSTSAPATATVELLTPPHRRHRRAAPATSAASPASARRCTASTPTTSRRWPAAASAAPPTPTPRRSRPAR